MAAEIQERRNYVLQVKSPSLIAELNKHTVCVCVCVCVYVCVCVCVCV